MIVSELVTCVLSPLPEPFPLGRGVWGWSSPLGVIVTELGRFQNPSSREWGEWGVKEWGVMGLCGSAKVSATYKTADTAALVEQLQLPRGTIEKLEKIFNEIDADKSGEVDVGEFLAYFELERTKFSKRVFSVMDADGSGEMSFLEFVLSVWNYCTFNKYSLIRFAFELYDEDDSGFIDTSEMEGLLRDVYGKRALKTNRHAVFVLEKIKTIGGGADMEIPYRTFLGFANQHPALLFPAFHLQFGLQQKILGSKFWESMEKRRRKIERSAAAADDEEHSPDDDINFKTVLKYLESMTEAERTVALGQSLDAVVDVIDQKIMNSAAQGASQKQQANRSASAQRKMKDAPNTVRSKPSLRKRDSLMSGEKRSGKTWRCKNCGRTNYPVHAACRTCRRPRK